MDSNGGKGGAFPCGGGGRAESLLEADSTASGLALDFADLAATLGFVAASSAFAGSSAFDAAFFRGLGAAFAIAMRFPPRVQSRFEKSAVERLSLAAMIA
jgi:hypothetical protein